MYGPVLIDKEKNEWGFVDGNKIVDSQDRKTVRYTLDALGTLCCPTTGKPLGKYIETTEQAHLNDLRKKYGPPAA